MKLNMDLVREILIWCESNLPDDEKSLISREIEFPGYKPEEVAFHFKLLADERYIEAIDASDNIHRFDCFPEYLTFSGYEFLGAIRSDTIWNGMKEEAGKIGIHIVKIALPILAQLIAKQAGLNP